MSLLSGKKVVIFGVANEKSIAWAIARAFHEQGAELAKQLENLERLREEQQALKEHLSPARRLGQLRQRPVPA